MTATEALELRGANAARPFCRPLDAVDEPTAIGGKASALGRMMRAGLPVPNGFVIVAAALESHLSANAIGVRIEKLCAELDAGDPGPEAGRRTSAAIGALVREARLPDQVWRDVFAHARPLLVHGRVVVRSSAIGEDGASDSFAGQLDSILHVGDEATLQRALLDCWSSQWSERALFYRHARRLDARGMGVVVQRQVEARGAGVLFTTTTEGPMLVEFAPGLGDALVGGAIDPGRASIDRATAAVEQLAVAAPRQGEVFALETRVALQLRDAGLAVERAFGAPQDVEWALDSDETLYLVQSRPITAPVSIGGGSVAETKSGRMVSWSNANVNENFPGPISPLLYSIAQQGYTHYFRNLAVAFGISPDRVAAMEPAFQRIIGVHGARMYYNLTSIHSVLRLAPFGAALTASFDTFVGANGAGVDTNTVASAGRSRQVVETVVIAFKAAKRFFGIDHAVQRFERTIDAFAARTTPARLATMSLGELGASLAGFMEIRCHRWLDASLADASSMMCYGALERLLKRAYGVGDRSGIHTSLLKAIPNVVSGEPVLQLWALSRRVRADEELHRRFESTTATDLLRAIDGEPALARFRTEFQRYLDDWGFRCSEELMLTSPSFQENPAPVIEMIRAYARIDGPTPSEALAAQALDREETTHRVFAELHGRFVWRSIPITYPALLGLLLPWTHAAIRYRERARLKQALLYARCRRIALATGEELVRRELLAQREDVFFLSVSELLELTSGGGGAMLPGAVRSLVRVRRDEHERASALSPPDAFTLPEGEYFTCASPRRSVDVAATDLRGTPACGGRVTGRAMVLRDTTEAGRLERGDVLVTKQTDPGWGPVFFLISGLVIERGGMLSHGAIIAREFGIPCVVGVRDATRRIASGSTITVDGDRGEINEAPVAD
jgi:rifampicin phosphotransferase